MTIEAEYRVIEGSKIQAIEMKLLRQTKGCARKDHIYNEDVRTKLETCSINDRMYQYKFN